MYLNQLISPLIPKKPNKQLTNYIKKIEKDS